MTPYLQICEHDPDNGQIGDCWRTAIGCLLNMPPEEVPHFCQGNWQNAAAVEKLTREWLNGKGYSFIEVPYDDSVESVLEMCAQMYPDIYYIISGKIDKGPDHATIGLGGEIVWDPGCPMDGTPHSTINQRCSDGYVWLMFLIPLIITTEYK